MMCDNKPSGKNAESHQRQDDRQQHLTWLPRRPVQISDRDAVIADKGLGHDSAILAGLGVSEKSLRSNERPISEMKVFVDIA